MVPDNITYHTTYTIGANETGGTTETVTDWDEYDDEYLIYYCRPENDEEEIKLLAAERSRELEPKPKIEFSPKRISFDRRKSIRSMFRRRRSPG